MIIKNQIKLPLGLSMVNAHSSQYDEIKSTEVLPYSVHVCEKKRFVENLDLSAAGACS